MSIPISAILAAILGVGIIHHIRCRLSAASSVKYWRDQVDEWQEITEKSQRQTSAVLQDMRDLQALYDKARRDRDQLQAALTEALQVEKLNAEFLVDEEMLARLKALEAQGRTFELVAINDTLGESEAGGPSSGGAHVLESSEHPPDGGRKENHDSK